MDDRSGWGTPPDPSARSGAGPADALPVDDRIDEPYTSVVDTGRRTRWPGAESPAERVAVALVGLLMVCAAVGLAVVRSGGTGASSSDTDWVEKSDVWAADRTPQVIDDLVEVVGGTQFTGVYLRTDSASAVAPTASGVGTTDRFSWRDGRAERDGAEGRLDSGGLFDVTTVDWTAVEGLVAQGRELSGIDDRSVAVDVERAVDRGASAAVRIGLHMCDGSYRCANIIADQQGQIVWMDSEVEGSPAFEWEAAGFYQPDRMQQLVDDLVVMAGTTQFVALEVSVWGVGAEAPAGGEMFNTISWFRGFAWVSSVRSGQVDAAALLDTTAVDWTLVGSLAAQTRDLTGVDDPQPGLSVYCSTSRGQVFEFRADDGNVDPTSGTVVFDMTGQVVSMRGGAPGSASEQWEVTH